MRRIPFIILIQPGVQEALRKLEQSVGADQAERVVLREEPPPVLKCPDIVDEVQPPGREPSRVKAERRAEARDRTRQQMVRFNAKRRTP